MMVVNKRPLLFLYTIIFLECVVPRNMRAISEDTAEGIVAVCTTVVGVNSFLYCCNESFGKAVLGGIGGAFISYTVSHCICAGFVEGHTMKNVLEVRVKDIVGIAQCRRSQVCKDHERLLREFSLFAGEASLSSREEIAARFFNTDQGIDITKIEKSINNLTKTCAEIDEIDRIHSPRRADCKQVLSDTLDQLRETITKLTTIYTYIKNNEDYWTSYKNEQILIHDGKTLQIVCDEIRNKHPSILSEDALLRKEMLSEADVEKLRMRFSEVNDSFFRDAELFGDQVQRFTTKVDHAKLSKPSKELVTVIDQSKTISARLKSVGDVLREHKDYFGVKNHHVRLQNMYRRELQLFEEQKEATKNFKNDVSNFIMIGHMPPGRIGVHQAYLKQLMADLGQLRDLSNRASGRYSGAVHDADVLSGKLSCVANVALERLDELQKQQNQERWETGKRVAMECVSTAVLLGVALYYFPSASEDEVGPGDGD